jgi:hypothetical protein
MSLYRAMREDLDFVHPENPPERFPIIVRDTTEFTGWFMALASRRHGIFENGGPEVARALSRNRWLDTGYRGSHIIDEEIVPARELARHKLVGISNLNPSLASRDPDYTRLVLAAVYLRYKKRLLDSYPLQTPQILTMLRFAISSSHDDITKQANLIPGHEVVPMTWEETSIRIDANYGAIRTAPRMNMTLGPSFVFSSAAIEALLASNPRLARQAQGSLRSGAFQVRQLLDRPL